MSLPELYQWHREIRKHFAWLGLWQSFGLALYSYGVVVAQACAPSRVAEKLPGLGKADTVQRRLERWLANERIGWARCCPGWAQTVLSQYVGRRLVLLVDETKLGEHLSAMVVGLAYRGCCIPLAFWCYPAGAWPMGQVELIMTLLRWIAPSVPPGVIPLVQADRGIGTSPDLLRAIAALGWYFQVRVQKNTRFQAPDGQLCPLADLVRQAGHTWCGQGRVFKKAGWLDCRVTVLWGKVYRESWCLVTNCPWVSGWEYAVRYWQEASFRDLKSDGWQWQTSRIWTPAHANRLLLVLALAYAWLLSLGTLALDYAVLSPSRARRATYSVFRHGLRLWHGLLGRVAVLRALTPQPYFSFVEPPPLSLKTVGG